MERQLVIFELSNEHYGVDIFAVESIIKIQPIISLPQAPDCVVGITNLRGTVLPVIDLCKRFGLRHSSTGGDPAGAKDDRRIIVVAMGEARVGMIVDAVSEVLSIPSQSIEPPPPLVTSLDTAFITGIARLENGKQNGRLVILLDLDKVLTLEEKTKLQELPVAV